MATLTRDSVVCQARDVTTAPVDEELFMMRMESNSYYGLDAIGRHIWELLAESRTVAELCAALCAKYQVSAEQCEADVLHFLGSLAKDGVITVKNPAGA